MEALTTWEVGELLYGPLVVPKGATADEIRKARRLRQQKTGAEIGRIRRRTGMTPVPGRTDDSQRLWPAEAMRTAIAERPGKGNRTPRELRCVTRSGNKIA